MILKELIEHLYLGLENLPGENAHRKMAPYKRPEAKTVFDNPDINPKISAVALIFYPKNDSIHFCLTQRPDYNGTHGGQISFPGGKMEKIDTSLKNTALRETHEEVGIHPDGITILGELTQVYIPPSNFMVTPFIGYLDAEPTFKTNHEVIEIIEPSINDLRNSNNLSIEQMNTKYGKFKVPAYNFNDKIVWGATAVILSEFEALVNRK